MVTILKATEEIAEKEIIDAVHLEIAEKDREIGVELNPFVCYDVINCAKYAVVVKQTLFISCGIPFRLFLITPLRKQLISIFSYLL